MDELHEVDDLIERLPELIDDVIVKILTSEELGEVYEKEFKNQIVKSVLEKIKTNLDNQDKAKLIEGSIKKALDKKWKSIKSKIIEKTDISIIEKKKEVKQEKVITTPLKPTPKRKSAISSDSFFLKCAVNITKKFGLTLHNNSSNNYTEVKVNLELPSEIKVSKRTYIYGNLLVGESRKKHIKFIPKEEGIFHTKIIINSYEGHLATIPIEINVAQEDTGVEELIYKLTKKIKLKLYPHTPQVSLRLAEGIESLSGELKKKKIFKIIIENNSLVDYSLVNIRLTAPPQIRVSKIPAYVGDLDQGKTKIRKFGVVPKKKGIFTITAIATSSYGDLTTYTFDLYVGEEYMPQDSKIELIQQQEAEEAKLKIICPFCKIEIKKDDKFCPNCGKILKQVQESVSFEKATKVCPFCGKKIPIQAKFCAQCGKNLE